MHFAIYYIVPFLILLQFIQNLYSKNVELKYKYKYYALRDRLTMLVINRQINTKDPLYIQLDKELEKTSSNFSTLNSFLVLYILIFKNKTVQEESRKMKIEKMKFKNAKLLLDIYNEKKDLSYSFLKRKYPFTFLVSVLCVMAYSWMARWVSKKATPSLRYITATVNQRISISQDVIYLN